MSQKEITVKMIPKHLNEQNVKWKIRYKIG